MSKRLPSVATKMLFGLQSFEICVGDQVIALWTNRHSSLLAVRIGTNLVRYLTKENVTMLDKMNAGICQLCEAAVPFAEMNESGECAACVAMQKLQRIEHAASEPHESVRTPD
ncbi:hypothetical protein [Sulfitobacter sp.]|uniref:hypothetical protein n=1 Tax=Sulfitobacter sp. TaxID=1903071 RepID=UPI003002171A